MTTKIDVSNLKKIFEEININFIEIEKQIYFTNEEKQNFNSIKNIIEDTIKQLEKSINNYLTSSYFNDMTQNLLNIKSHINNFVLYSSNQNHRNAIFVQNILPIIKNIQDVLLKVIFFGNPKSTKEMLKINSEDLLKNAEALEFENNSLQKLRNNIEEMEILYNDKTEKFESKIEKFHCDLEDAKNTFSSDITKLNNDFKTECNEEKNKFSVFVKSSEKEKDDFIKQIEEDFDRIKSKAEEIVGSISGKAQAYVYDEYSKINRKSRNFWQFMSLAFILLAIIAAIFSLFNNINNSGTGIYVELIIKITICLSFGSAAAYCARIASKEYKSEVRNKTINMDLLTLDEFLKGVKDADEVKAKLAEKYYGNFETKNFKKDESNILTVKTLTKLVKAINKTPENGDKK